MVVSVVLSELIVPSVFVELSELIVSSGFVELSEVVELEEVLLSDPGVIVASIMVLKLHAARTSEAESRHRRENLFIHTPCVLRVGRFPCRHGALQAGFCL